MSPHTLATEVDIWLSPAPYGVMEDANGLVIRDADGLPICVFYTTSEAAIDERAAHDAHAYAHIVPVLKAATELCALLPDNNNEWNAGAVRKARDSLHSQILAALGKLPTEAP